MTYGRDLYTHPRTSLLASTMEGFVQYGGIRKGVVRLLSSMYTSCIMHKPYSYLFQIPFRRHVREIVSDTFEIYLRIMREVDRRIKVRL